MERLCSKKSPAFEFAGNSLFSIKCDNYKLYFEFDTEGEILGQHLTQPPTPVYDGFL